MKLKTVVNGLVSFPFLGLVDRQLRMFKEPIADPPERILRPSSVIRGLSHHDVVEHHAEALCGGATSRARNRKDGRDVRPSPFLDKIDNADWLNGFASLRDKFKRVPYPRSAASPCMP